MLPFSKGKIILMDKLTPPQNMMCEIAGVLLNSFLAMSIFLFTYF